MNYEQYHKKGGTYELPVEVFDNFLDEKEYLEKENKQLKGSLQTHEILLKANVKENQELKEQLQQKEDIIKKSKEYIKNELLCFDNESIEYIEGLKILKILDSKGE